LSDGFTEQLVLEASILSVLQLCGSVELSIDESITGIPMDHMGIPWDWEVLL